MHGTYGSRRLTTILFFTSGWGRNIFASFKPPRQGTEPGNEPGIGVKGSGANRYPRAPAHLYRQEHYTGRIHLTYDSAVGLNDYFKLNYPKTEQMKAV